MVGRAPRLLPTLLIVALVSVLAGCGGKIKPLTITTAALAEGEVTFAYSQTLTAIDGREPYSWNMAPGSGLLPPGLTLSNAGVISGTPTIDGVFDIIVQAVDSRKKARVGTRAYSLAVSIRRNEITATATSISNGTFDASLSPFVHPLDENPVNPDVDVYRITSAFDSEVVVETFAQDLLPDASPMDSVIEIVDVNGNRLTTCRNLGTDDGVTGNNDPTPTAFDDICLNDDIELGVRRDSWLELKVPANATTFYVRVLDWTGNARPDFLYSLVVTGAN